MEIWEARAFERFYTLMVAAIANEEWAAAIHWVERMQEYVDLLRMRQMNLVLRGQEQEV